MSRPIRVVPAILAINILVFLGWQFSTEQNPFFFNHFLISTNHLKAGHVWTLITSAFSHVYTFHLLFNMIVLWSFGSVLERLLGAKRFLILYLSAAIISSFAHVFTSSVLMDAPGQPALGASGALASILLVFGLMFPKVPILLFGIIPIPALVAVSLFVGFDILGLLGQTKGLLNLPIGHAAHLGGSLTGVIYYLKVIRPKMKRAKIRPILR